MNRDSSRSHCIFTLYVETATPSNVEVIWDGTSNQAKSGSKREVLRMGKLNLVDLAGSEK
jgi:hypothetical protein